MPPQSPEGQEKKPLKSLRTYQGDVDEILSQGKASSTTILVSEQKRREEHPEKVIDPVKNEKRNHLLVTLSSSFLIIGVLTIGVVYYIKATEKVAVEEQETTLLNFTSEATFSMANSIRSNLVSKITSAIKEFNGPENTILYVKPTNINEKEVANLNDILTILTPNMPGSLVRSFENKYMLGSYFLGGNQPFIIISVKDYAESYGGMLEWEKDIPKDLGEIFGLDENLASSTSLFKDEAVKNKDLRVLKNQSQKVVMIYSFISKNTLLITTNEDVFTAILGKYQLKQEAR
jgi:hypothetical protein